MTQEFCPRCGTQRLGAFRFCRSCLFDFKRQRLRRSRPQTVAAVAVGIAIGGWAGATIKGSGMFDTELFVGGCLLLVLALAGLGALAAARTDRTSAARNLAGFAGAAVVATGVAIAIASPYRSPTAPPELLFRGSATVQVAELAAIEWRGDAECRTRPSDPTWFTVYMQDTKAEDRPFWVLVNLLPGATSIQIEKFQIATSANRIRPIYIASPGSGLDATQVSTNGLTGNLRFSAVLEPNPAYSPDPEFDWLTGTFEWACEPTPSG